MEKAQYFKEDAESIITLNQDEIVFQEYENMYISQGDLFPSVYFAELGPQQRQEQVLKIIRFAIKYYLQWTPSDVQKYLTSKVLKKLKLTKLINKYITFPAEYSKYGLDMTYLAYLLYPNKFSLSMEDQCIAMFERVHSGDISKFPSAWMDGMDGIRRFSILLQYAITQLPRFDSQESMYQFFAGPKGTQMLKEYKLYSFALSLYSTTFEAFHMSMPKHLRSDFLYHYFRFSKKVKITI